MRASHWECAQLSRTSKREFPLQLETTTTAMATTLMSTYHMLFDIPPLHRALHENIKVWEILRKQPSRVIRLPTFLTHAVGLLIPFTISVLFSFVFFSSLNRVIKTLKYFAFRIRSWLLPSCAIFLLRRANTVASVCFAFRIWLQSKVANERRRKKKSKKWIADEWRRKHVNYGMSRTH